MQDTQMRAQPPRSMPRRLRSAVLARMVAGVAQVRRMHSDVDRTIVISGRPRSGTTWLQEMVASMTGFPSVMEPLNLPKVADLIEPLRLTWHTYRDPDVEDAAFTEFLRGILAGTFLRPSFFLPTPENFLKFLRSGPLIVKFCRANLFLPYLHARFSRTPTVLLVRDPFASVASQILHGNWDDVDTFVPHHPAIYRDYPEFALDPAPTAKEEILAAHWCIEHAYLERNLARLGGVHVLRYEDMFRDPATYLPKLASYIGVPWEERFLELVNVKSRTIKPGSALSGEARQDPTRQHTKQLDGAQRARIQAMLERFGYPFYTREELAP